MTKADAEASHIAFYDNFSSAYHGARSTWGESRLQFTLATGIKHTDVDATTMNRLLQYISDRKTAAIPHALNLYYCHLYVYHVWIEGTSIVGRRCELPYVGSVTSGVEPARRKIRQVVQMMHTDHSLVHNPLDAFIFDLFAIRAMHDIEHQRDTEGVAILPVNTTINAETIMIGYNSISWLNPVSVLEQFPDRPNLFTDVRGNMISIDADVFIRAHRRGFTGTDARQFLTTISQFYPTMPDHRAIRMAYMLCEMQAAVTRRHPPAHDVMTTRGYDQTERTMPATAEEYGPFFEAIARQFLQVQTLHATSAPLTWINHDLNLTLFMGHASNRGFIVQAIRHAGDPATYFRAEEAALSDGETNDETSDDDRNE